MEKEKKILDDCFRQTLFFIEKIFRNYLLTGSCLIKHYIYTKQTKHFNFLVQYFTVIYSFFVILVFLFETESFVEVHFDSLDFHYWRYLAQKKLNKLFNKRNSSGCKKKRVLQGKWWQELSYIFYFAQKWHSTIWTKNEQQKKRHCLQKINTFLTICLRCYVVWVSGEQNTLS